MKQISTILTFCFAFSFLNSVAQQTDDCYLVNKAEYERLGLKNYNDNYLKPKIKYYFSCDDTKPEPTYFVVFKSQLINDSAVESKTDNGYEIEFASTEFKADKHKVLKNSQGYICKIDGKAFYGTDENLPTEEFKSIKVKFNKKEIGIPSSEYKDLFNPFLKYGGHTEHLILLKDKRSDYLLILFYGSDGAGGYAVMWIFNKGKYVGRIVDKPC
jgi:hypothetical protein